MSIGIAWLFACLCLLWLYFTVFIS